MKFGAWLITVGVLLWGCDSIDRYADCSKGCGARGVRIFMKHNDNDGSQLYCECGPVFDLPRQSPDAGQ